MLPVDAFGVEKLYPDAATPREWACSWGNGQAREITTVQTDPKDKNFHLRGSNGALVIDGRGIARLSGETPRMYVYNGTQKWGNVEVTFYARRIREYAAKSSQGFVAGARSEHQDAGTHPCQARTYYGRLLYDGRANFQKELYHDAKQQVYTDPADSKQLVWNPPNPHLPVGEWVGVKFVVATVPVTHHVRLQLFRDRSGGLGSGYWEKVAQYDDAGAWTAVTTCPQHPADQVFRDPATSVFVRNDFLTAAEYARFSVREIDPAGVT